MSTATTTDTTTTKPATTDPSVQWTIAAIKQANGEAGRYWFAPSTLAFFKSIVEPTVYQGPGGVYFVSSEQGPDEVRRWSVRKFNPRTADVGTAGEFQEHKTVEEARTAARKWAAGVLRSARKRTTDTATND